MTRRLSSLATPYYRFAPPLLLAFGVAWMVTHLRSVQPMGAILYVAVFAVLSAWSLPLKKVQLSNDRLFVSNYFRRIVVPAAAIANVESSTWLGSYPRTVKVHLDDSSEFGSEIVFIPRGLGWLASEVVDEIREARHAA